MTELTDTGHPKNWACDSHNKCSQDEDHSGIDAECFSQLPDLIVNYEMCEYRRLEGGVSRYRFLCVQSRASTTISSFVTIA